MYVPSGSLFGQRDYSLLAGVLQLGIDPAEKYCMISE